MFFPKRLLLNCSVCMYYSTHTALFVLKTPKTRNAREEEKKPSHPILAPVLQRSRKRISTAFTPHPPHAIHSYIQCNEMRMCIILYIAYKYNTTSLEFECAAALLLPGLLHARVHIVCRVYAYVLRARCPLYATVVLR